MTQKSDILDKLSISDVDKTTSKNFLKKVKKAVDKREW